MKGKQNSLKSKRIKRLQFGIMSLILRNKIQSNSNNKSHQNNKNNKFHTMKSNSSTKKNPEKKS